MGVECFFDLKCSIYRRSSQIHGVNGYIARMNLQNAILNGN